MSLEARINVRNLDFSGFVSVASNQINAIVVKSRKGPKVPLACQSEQDVLVGFGNPVNTDASYASVFEAIESAIATKTWVCSAYASDARYAGIDVTTTGLRGFGSGAGRVFETFGLSSYTALSVPGTTYTLGTGNGTNAVFSGTIPGISGTNIINHGSLIIKNGGTAVSATESGGAITGSAISGSGTLNISSGAINYTYAGSAGTVSTYTSVTNGASNFDLSSGGTAKAINLTIDGTLHANLSFGSGAATTLASIVSAINLAAGYTAASVSGGQFIHIVGQIADATYGKIIIGPPTDLVTYGDATNIVFLPTGTVSVTGTNPTGSIPRYNQTVTLDFITTSDQSQVVSHSFFTFSPCSDTEYGAIISHTGNRDFVLDLYYKQATGYTLQQSYTYSLDRKTSNGISLYIDDVFKNNLYVIPYVNTAYTGTLTFTTPTTQVDLTGGTRGGEPQASDYLAAWNNFRDRRKYKTKTFLDAIGNSAATILSIRDTYQPQAFCATVIPMGNDVASAQTYRSSLAIDNDQIALYWNWTQIQDPYNNSTAWVSRIGAVGVIYAGKDLAYDSTSPAGINRNLEGGQVNFSKFTPITQEYGLSDADTLILDAAQINPIILDPDYGLMLEGDITLKVTNSDTSYIGTRRLYNLMIDTIRNQILKQQVFKNNTPTNRLTAKTLTDQFTAPILAGEFINFVQSQCDEKNNTDNVRNQRNFILSIYVQATTNSQKVELQFVRLPQGAVTAQFLPTTA